ncbi:MAG: hypothetical protein FWC39_07835 [Bacteroidetes bacterium]|nr:hypothetical protein [Bacteroidota bacterium]
MTFNKDRTFQEIFTDTFVFLQQEWRSFFLCIAIYAAPLLAAAHYFSSKIIITNQLDLVSKEMFTFLVFAAIGYFLLQSITYCYIACFVQNQNSTPTRQMVLEFFSKNILTCIKAFLIFGLIFGLGFLMYFIPGLILLAPLSLFVFDKIFTGTSSMQSLTRSMQLTRSNISLTYSVVLLSYIASFLFQFFVGSLFSSFPTGALILINTAISVASTSIVYIIIALLYFSLRSKIQKPYDNYQ